MGRRVWRWAAVALVASSPVAASIARPPGAAGQPSGAAVGIVDFDYRQRSVTVTAGSIVTWTNTGARPHTATDRGGTFDTEPIAPGARATVRLDVPGVYSFFCKINPKLMNGTVIVEPGAASPTAVRVQTVDNGNVPTETLRFEPDQLTVDVGTDIVVANVGGQRHSLRLDDGSLATPVLPPGPENGRFAGTNITIRATNPGTFPFHCEVHPDVMRGVLVVRAVPEPASTAPPPLPSTEPPPTTALPPSTAPPTTAPPTTALPTTAPPTTAPPTTPPPTAAPPSTAPPADAAGDVSLVDLYAKPGKGTSVAGVLVGLLLVVAVGLGVTLAMRRRTVPGPR